MKHINVALFVPDEGCPNRCSFCNQKTISGKTKRLEPHEVDRAVEVALNGNRDTSEGEIAFFGGSFTAIEREYMLSLLQKAKAYVDEGLFKGIRISTRPDCIDDEVLCILKKYGVTSIELGCQSMDERVLMMNNRGHDSGCVVTSAKLIKEYGFELGVQMMTGLYGDTDETAVETAKKLISLSPDTVRIYPTVVLENTELHRLYLKGEYEPPSVDSAVHICAVLIRMFENAGVKVIRVGLHSGGNVDEGFVAGAFHPAFKELCDGEIYLNEVLNQIKEKKIVGGAIEIKVAPRYISALTGQKKCNVNRLLQMGYSVKIEKQNELEKYQVEVRGL